MAQRAGSLVIQQRKKRGGATGREVCTLSLANPSELKDFFDGLRSPKAIQMRLERLGVAQRA